MALNSYKFGQIAELLAVLFLRCKLYKIVKRRMRNIAGEIDIIARKNNTLIFIEVKARKRDEHLFETISSKQKHRINQAAMLFVAQNKRFHHYDLRFDAILITKNKLPIHILNAW